MRSIISLAVLTVLSFPCLLSAQTSSPPEGSLLADDTDWDLVYANCSSCHSLRLVVGQRGNADTWLRLIRWMQETQNLWTFEPNVESRILGYLTRNYAPEVSSRRAPLTEDQLPPRR